MFGQLIVFEGGDAGGKSTAIKHLKEKHPEFVYSREPSGEIRELVLSDNAKDFDSLTRLLLFWGSRSLNFERIIFPALLRGETVVTDRFDVSTWCYQVGEDPRLEPLFWEARKTCLNGVVPVYFDFKVSVEVSRKRLEARGGQNHFDLMDDEFHQRVRAQYDRFFERNDIRSRQINADLSEDEVFSQVIEKLEEVRGS